MNKVYRLIWNAATGAFVAAPETAKGRKKSGSVRRGTRAIGALAILTSAAASAEDMQIAPSWDADNSGKLGQTVFDSKGDHTLSGVASFAFGQAGTQMSLADAVRNGYGQGTGLDSMRQLVITGKSSSVAVPDLATGGKRTVAVYNAASFAEGAWGTRFEGAGTANNVVVFPKDVKPYLDLRIATVLEGALSVDLGETYLNLGAAKHTALIKVEKSDGDSASAVWNSSNTVNFGSSSLITATPEQTTPREIVRNQVIYNGDFDVVTGPEDAQVVTRISVSDVSSLTEYNDWLIGKLATGDIAAGDYDVLLSKAYTFVPQRVWFEPLGSGRPALETNDPLFATTGVQTLLHADGKDAQASIGADSQIVLVNGHALYATNGGRVENHGRIGQSFAESYGFNVNSGSTGINYGVVTQGYSTKSEDASPEVGAEVYFTGSNRVSGAGSQLVNRGIINVGAVNRDIRSSPTLVAVSASSNGTFVNEGAINLGVNESMMNNAVMGLRSMTGGRIVNAEEGVIYLGREASSDMSGGALAAGGDDTLVNAGGNAIVVQGAGSAENYGTIVIGSKMQNSSAIWVDGTQADPASAVNFGTIEVHGAREGAALENRGIYVTGGQTLGSNVANRGHIRLTGVNGVGVKAVGGSNATSYGTIEVGTSSNPLLANFGMWAEGVGSQAALNGDVLLTGSNAVGVHARAGGTLNVDGGEIRFDKESTRQVGFFAYGQGSIVNISGAPVGGLNVSSEGSTLFRIENGANINNSSRAPMVASGENSTLVLVTGEGSTANLDSMEMTVEGAGSTALKIEGGASGTMSGTGEVITFNDDTIAVSIDDFKYDLAGNRVGVGQSKFTNTANLTVGASAGAPSPKNVTLFQVRNGAELSNGGDIDLAHGTAIEIVGEGSEVTSAGRTGTITVHDGVAGIHVRGGATLKTSDTITVDGGASGVLIGEDSGRVVLTEDARIIGQGSGFGNLVTNRAQAGTTLLDGTFLEMQGSGAALFTEHDLDARSHGTILVSSQVGGKGLMLAGVDGSATSGDLHVGDNFDISVSGNGSGVFANTSGSLTVSSGTVHVGGEGHAVLVESADTVTITEAAHLVGANIDAVLIGGAPKKLVNMGNLDGILQSHVIHLDDSGHSFENIAGGRISGDVHLGNGTNSTLLRDSSIHGSYSGGAGSDVVTIAGSGVVVSDYIDGGVGSADDVLVFDGASYAVSSSDHISNFEAVELKNGSAVSLSAALRLGDAGVGRGVVSVDERSTLNLRMNESFEFDNRLTGTGRLQVSTQNNFFDFGANVGEHFAGTVSLGETQFVLGSASAATLSKAVLDLGAGSTTFVESGTNAIGGLRFNGGTAIFDVSVPDRHPGAGLTVGSLDLSGRGTVSVSIPDPYLPANPVVDDRLTLLEQDDGNVGAKIVSSHQVAGSAGALALTDQNGDVISDRRNLSVEQHGAIVATGHYDYRMTAAPGDGLYVNYGLKELDIQDGSVLELHAREGSPSPSRDLSARVTGAGGLKLDAGESYISLSNTSNDYAGVTKVSSGTVVIGADNALGHTSQLQLESGASAHMRGHSQTVGQLMSHESSTLDLQGGALTILGGGDASGALQGAGNLTLAGGRLSVDSNNESLAARVSIAGAALVEAKHISALGTGAIQLEGALMLSGAAGKLVNSVAGGGDLSIVEQGKVALVGDSTSFFGKFVVDEGSSLQAGHARNVGTASIDSAGDFFTSVDDAWSFSNELTGDGNFWKSGDAELFVGDNLKHSGRTNVEAGRLVLGDSARPATLGALGASSVSIGQSATLVGSGNISGNVEVRGTLAVGSSGSLVLAQGLHNAGVVDLHDGQAGGAGNVLVVSENYTGADGTVALNVVLGGDNSVTDRLHVLGDVEGTTRLEVRNVNGQGGQTAQGIRVVQVDGASNGEFTLAGRVAAGAYDYFLHRGGANSPNDGDWYLRSQLPSVPDACPPNSSAVECTPMPEPDVDGSFVLRPEVNAYESAMDAIRGFTQQSMHDRMGEPQFAERIRDDDRLGSGWARVAHTQIDHAGTQLPSVGRDDTLVQLGADVARWGQTGRGQVGLMMSNGRSTGTTASEQTGYAASARVTGTEVGGYFTWFADVEADGGLYLDAWAQTGRYRVKLQGDQVAADFDRVRTRSGSIEAGYALPVWSTQRSRLHIEPQVQLIYSQLDESKRSEVAASLAGAGGEGLTSRVGMRVFGHAVGDSGNRVQPFIGANWYRDHGRESISVQGQRLARGIPRDRYEIKMGAQMQLGGGWTGWGHAAAQHGGNDFRSVGGEIGLKYSW